MNTFNKGEFSESVVALDNSEFIDCKFDKCTLVYQGGVPPKFQDCKVNQCGFTFDSYAGNTLHFLQILNNVGFASVVNEIFDEVRKPVVSGVTDGK